MLQPGMSRVLLGCLVGRKLGEFNQMTELTKLTEFLLEEVIYGDPPTDFLRRNPRKRNVIPPRASAIRKAIP